MQPEVVARERHHHRTHPERHPSCDAHGAHAGIDQRVAGVALVPRAQQTLVRMHLVAQANVRVTHRLELEPRLILQLLHEMTMPPKPRPETGYAFAPPRINRVAGACGIVELAQPCACRVFAGSHTDCTGAQPRTHAAARVGCAAWTGHCSAIVHTALAQEGAQCVARHGLAAVLHAGTRSAISHQRFWRHLRLRDRETDAVDATRRRQWSGSHPCFPRRCPSVTRVEPPDHACLW